MAAPTAPYLARVRAAYPELAISSARVVETESQFNDVLVVNEEIVLRFPRNKVAASALTREVAVLRGLQGRLPLPVSNPTLTGYDAATGAIDWMSYALLPGEPLWSEELDALDKADRRQIALQLAGFLHAFHTLPPTEVAPELHARDEGQFWAGLFAAFRAEVFSFMRPAARGEVDALGDAILAELERTTPTPVLIHGDFGGGNILYDPATLRLTGVIDFGGVAVGNPAVDIAALSCYGEPFLAIGAPAYPGIAMLLPRARRYRATFALQQALWALRDGDEAAFEDGISVYR
ncbi:MAG: phosphotransferase [Chloroflexi bacterium OHK40]